MKLLKIILNEDINGLGKKGEIIDIKEGYARNFIIPRNLGIPMTKSTLKKLEKEKDDAKFKESKIKKAAEAIADKLHAQTLVIEVKGGANGKIFGSVTHKDVAEAIKNFYGVEVDRKKIQLDEEHLKHTGEHVALIKLHPEVRISLRFIVKAVEN